MTLTSMRTDSENSGYMENSSPSDVFQAQVDSQNSIKEIIEILLNSSYSIVKEKMLEGQRFSHAAFTMTRELLIDATSANFYLPPQIESVEADEDLELPKPDSWCSGVLEFCTPDEIEFRVTTLPEVPQVVVHKKGLPNINFII